MYSVQYTQTAQQDLVEIAVFIASDNVERALSFVSELEQHFYALLSIFPNAGYLHNTARGIRKKSYKGYTAFYHVIDETVVEVLHVVNLEKPLHVRGITLDE